MDKSKGLTNMADKTKDIEKETVDLLKQELETYTYVVDYNEGWQDFAVTHRHTWKAVSAEDNVTLMRMDRVDLVASSDVIGKQSEYCLYIMEKKVFAKRVNSEQAEDSKVKDAKLPQNVRAAFDLLKQYAKLDCERLFAQVQLAARVKMRGRGK